MTDRAFHSVREVAELLGIRQHGVTALIRSGELRGVDVSLQPGGRPRWRIMQEDLEAFIARRTHQAAAPRRRRRKPTNVKQYF
ncbi:MAG: helix-turn-helix domain-containing protein [Planctomycetaceae bacterium]|nr:helix-turn-helix domain-containing protein [Planctomycetaceae bacterium]